MLRWLVDTQTLPALMWLLVAQSGVLFGLLLWLPAARLLLRAPVGERLVRRLFAAGAEIAPMTGILGTVCGFAAGLRHFGTDDAHVYLVGGLKTAMYSTGYGLVLAIVAVLVVTLWPWRIP